MSPGPRRRWLEVRVRAPGAGPAAPLLAEGLMALGARAVEERAGWYVTALEEPGDETAFEARARSILADMTGARDLDLELEWRAHEDWADTWKRGLGVRHITDRLVVRPSWIHYTPVTDREEVIVLDPGMAFGTAEHGTTRGCLRLLDEALRPGERVLDVGSGSGILAVAAARLGAAGVVAVEGDPLACEALRENVARNGVEPRVRVVEVWADPRSLRAHGPYDGVVANLETGLLLPLARGLAGAVETDGWLIVSGILEDEWPAVDHTFAGLGWEVRRVDREGGWVSARLARAEGVRPPSAT